MKDITLEQPDDGQLVLTCIKRTTTSYNWRVLRYYSDINGFKCPYMHNRCNPSHWQVLPKF